MSKLVLELEYDFDFFLLGVSSHVANYRLAWGMNQQFELDLERVDDIDLSFGPQKKGNLVSIGLMMKKVTLLFI